MTLSFLARTFSNELIESPLSSMWFPGGEAHIKGAEDNHRIRLQIADLRGADPEDLITLAMWADCCHERKEQTALLLPYLPGARADRGVPFGARVYARLINSMSITRIVTTDPHSDVMPDMISRLTIYPFSRILNRAIGSRGDTYNHPYVGVIAPDKGAVTRASKAARVLHVPVFLAEKHRDFQTGKLSGFSCEALPDSGKLLVVDDICDGGGTFNGLADEINIGPDRLDLWVTHGIFSKGTKELKKRFGSIHTTDSHPGAPSAPAVVVHPISSYLIGEITNGE